MLGHQRSSSAARVPIWSVDIATALPNESADGQVFGPGCASTSRSVGNTWGRSEGWKKSSGLHELHTLPVVTSIFDRDTWNLVDSLWRLQYLRSLMSDPLPRPSQAPRSARCRAGIWCGRTRTRSTGRSCTSGASSPRRTRRGLAPATRSSRCFGCRGPGTLPNRAPAVSFL